MSDVYFYSAFGNAKHENMPNKIRNLYDKLGFNSCFDQGNSVAVKVHFGEKGNTTYMHPVAVRQVVDKIKEGGGKPFLTDTNTLYSGSRTNSIDHMETAIENGFAYSVVRAPIIIADGILSKNFVDVEINKKNFKTVKIGGEIERADAMLVMSHFKGHSLAGFGGAIKNMAMGCASAAGKQMQHSDAKPKVNRDLCIGCGRCYRNCPVDAISMVDGKAKIDHDICYGCGECVTVCPVKPDRAISVQWETSPEVFLEKMAEHAYGAIVNKQQKVAFITIVNNITPLCDCSAWSGRPLAPDIGILASTDPVALDQACFDLIYKEMGHDVFNEEHENVDGSYIFKYAESIGMGSTFYNLINL